MFQIRKVSELVYPLLQLELCEVAVEWLLVKWAKQLPKDNAASVSLAAEKAAALAFQSVIGTVMTQVAILPSSPET